jgi:hypothetical protein
MLWIWIFLASSAIQRMIKAYTKWSILKLIWILPTRTKRGLRQSTERMFEQLPWKGNLISEKSFELKVYKTLCLCWKTLRPIAKVHTPLALHREIPTLCCSRNINIYFCTITSTPKRSISVTQPFTNGKAERESFEGSFYGQKFRVSVECWLSGEREQKSQTCACIKQINHCLLSSLSFMYTLYGFARKWENWIKKAHQSHRPKYL